MKTLYKKYKNLLNAHLQTFDVAYPVTNENKNQPAIVMQECRNNESVYDKNKFINIISQMSDEDFSRFCNDTYKLQQFADTYNGLAAIYYNDELDETPFSSWQMVNPLLNEIDTDVVFYDEPTEEELKNLEEKVRNFIEIQPGYSHQPLDVFWRSKPGKTIEVAFFDDNEYPISEPDNVWVMYGKNVVEGITGIGLTCELAYQDFFSKWNRLRGEEFFKRNSNNHQ